MKVFKLLFMAVTAIALQACGPDWDQWDAPAGNQKAALLEKMASYTFDDGKTEPLNVRDFMLSAYNGGDIPTLATEGSETENPRATQFLNLNGGYVRIINPVKGNAQDAVSLVFFVKKAAGTGITFKDETLFSFQNADGTQQVAMTANGSLLVNTLDGTYAFNNDVTTGMLAADGEWHKVAVAIRNQNYFIFVDGEKRLDFTPPSSYKSSTVDMQKVVNFMANAPYIYYGNNSYETLEQPALAYKWLIDDIDVYRNTITEREWRYTKSSGGGGGGGSTSTFDFLPSGTEGFFLYKGSLADVCGTGKTAQLVTEEAQTTPSDFEEDADRGMVWHQQEGWNGHANGKAFLQIPNPLYGKTLTGATISFWVKAPTVNWWDSLWGVTDEVGHMWFNGNGYFGFNASGQWFDCQNDNGDNAITADKWTHVAISITKSGFKVYYDGAEKFSENNNAKWAASGTIDYGVVLDYMAACENMFFGHGSFWGAANAFISDFMVFPRALNATQISGIYTGTK